MFRGGKLNDKKNTKIKYNEGLRWPPFNILHATTNQKHVDVTEGGWDRMRYHARTLGEHNFNVLGLFSTSIRDPSRDKRERELGVC